MVILQMQKPAIIQTFIEYLKLDRFELTITLLPPRASSREKLQKSWKLIIMCLLSNFYIFNFDNKLMFLHLVTLSFYIIIH